MVSKTLILRVESFEKLYPSDLLDTFHLIEGRQINLPHIILCHMAPSLTPNLQSLVYPMLLTKVFEHFEVPLEGEEASGESTKFLSAKFLSAIKMGGSAPPCLQLFFLLLQHLLLTHPLHFLL
ncbi:hypothetical protein SESBI_10227 [Sesbania bispinosa]|nr:hypothetical protein SESBI_10227 [Sesbania bispinosa]